MRAAPADDAVDVAAQVWAEQWVAAYANGEGGQVGAMVCTLAAATPVHGGVSQHWPEVFRGEGLALARLLHALNPSDRLFVFRHYVERWYERGGDRWRRRRRPLPQRCMAAEMGLTHRRYLRRRDRLKRRLQAALWPPAKKVCTATSKSVRFGQVVGVSV